MLCRLCVYECLNENVNVLDSNLKMLISKYLYIKISQKDEASTTIICMNCRQHLEDFDEFFKAVEERQFYNEKATDSKPEKMETNSNSENSLTGNSGEQLEFMYAACCDEIDEAGDGKKDVLLLSEQLAKKASVEKNIPNAKVKKVTVTSRKLKQSLEIKVESQKEQVKNIFSPEEKRHSLTENTTEQLEFINATCADETDEACDDKEDVLLLSEQLETKAPISKNIPNAKCKKNTVARRKSKRKCSQKSLESKVEYPKKQSKNIFTPEEESQRDELVAKYVSLECELCQEKSESYKQFQSHFQKVHNQKAYITCCGKHLNKRSLILEHVEFHTNPEQFKCQLCDKTLKTRTSLNNHNNLYHNRTQLQHDCNICGKKFSYPSMLEKHLTVHETARNFVCELCQKRFKSKFALQWHIKHMHGERTVHICDICGKEYRFKLSFEQHVAEHQGTLVDQRKQCHICQVWVAPNYFKRHIQRHEKVDVACDICGQTFTTIPTLASHKERHHKQLKNYDCPYCDKTFLRPRYLKEHIDVHTGHKEYSCKYCTREFRSKANMYAHAKKMHHALWAQAQLDRTLGPEEKRAVVKNEGDEALIATI